MMKEAKMRSPFGSLNKKYTRLTGDFIEVIK